MRTYSALIFLIIAIFIQNSTSECPQVNDLPVYLRDDTFFCARFYYGFGDDLDIHGCNGGCSVASTDYYDLVDGADYDAGKDQQYGMGSVIVRPGCTLYTFHEAGYNGGWTTYEGPGLWSRVNDGHDAADSGM